MIKNIFKVVVILLGAVMLNGYLTARHQAIFTTTFEQCRMKLIAENNYRTIGQAFACVNYTSIEVRVLGTILFSDGSYLEGHQDEFND